MIKYPVRVEQNTHIRDASNRVLDLHEIAEALNAKAAPRSRAKKEKIEETLRRSDLTAQTAERDDIEYGHHESLPRGEHVARLGRRR